MEEEQTKKLIELYVKGYPYRIITKITGINYNRAKNEVRRLIAEGVLIDRKIKPKDKEQPVGTVKCTKAVSRKCIYGSDYAPGETALCNYILITGKRRGCPACACDKFKQGKKKKKSILY